ncbi:MAG: ATP-binding protein [Gemmatimonadota bacterium]|nr:ATP-binding protein [Gemmatimonadota bacterium]
MNWLDAIWGASAAVSLTFATVHLGVWALDRTVRSSLAFAAVALSVVAIAVCELGMMHAATVETFVAFERWIHLPIFTVVASIVAFIHLTFGPGRMWLGHAAWVTRLTALAVNFALPVNLTHSEITGLRQVQILGQSITVAEGVGDPWTWLARLSLAFLLAFILDSAVRLWRNGDSDDRRRAVLVGGGLFLFVFASVVHAGLVMSGAIRSPYMSSVIFLGATVAMGLALGHDVARAAELGRRLRQSEVALTDREARLRHVVDSAAEGIVAVDAERRVVQFNRAAAEMFLCQPSDVLGQPFTRFVSTHLRQPRFDGFPQPGEPEGADGLSNYLDQIRGLRADGEEFPIEASVSRVGDGDQALMYVVLRDVTARQQAEFEARLRRAEVARLSRVALLSELSGSLAHELNQPLGAILSNAQAMRRLLARDDPDFDEIGEILEDIIADDRRAGQVIARLRGLLERGESHHEEIELSELANEVLGLIHAELVENRVMLRTGLADRGVARVRGDRVQLQQVILNLLKNASDAMSTVLPGRRILRVGTERMEDGSARLTVADRGVGIDPDLLEDIFQPFFTTKQGGLGMGLGICRRIVEAHGGRLWAVNNPDEGATFFVSIPAID